MVQPKEKKTGTKKPNPSDSFERGLLGEFGPIVRRVDTSKLDLENPKTAEELLRCVEIDPALGSHSGKTCTNNPMNENSCDTITPEKLFKIRQKIFKAYGEVAAKRYDTLIDRLEELSPPGFVHAFQHFGPSGKPLPINLEDELPPFDYGNGWGALRALVGAMRDSERAKIDTTPIVRRFYKHLCDGLSMKEACGIERRKAYKASPQFILDQLPLTLESERFINPGLLVNSEGKLGDLSEAGLPDPCGPRGARYYKVSRRDDLEEYLGIAMSLDILLKPLRRLMRDSSRDFSERLEGAQESLRKLISSRRASFSVNTDLTTQVRDVGRLADTDRVVFLRNKDDTKATVLRALVQHFDLVVMHASDDYIEFLLAINPRKKEMLGDFEPALFGKEMEGPLKDLRFAQLLSIAACRDAGIEVSDIVRKIYIPNRS